LKQVISLELSTAHICWKLLKKNSVYESKYWETFRVVITYRKLTDIIWQLASLVTETIWRDGRQRCPSR